MIRLEGASAIAARGLDLFEAATAFRVGTISGLNISVMAMFRGDRRLKFRRGMFIRRKAAFGINPVGDRACILMLGHDDHL